MSVYTLKKHWKEVLFGTLVVAVGAAWFLGALPFGESAAPVKTTTPANYTEAVEQYEGKRIQFGLTCQAVPTTTTFKNGTRIMLDNRSGDARIITVGGVQYNLAGYGWKIITLSSATLPKTLSLGCGSAVNVGSILLQK